jgi:Fur family peroxide stress response transcriptional regulator
MNIEGCKISSEKKEIEDKISYFREVFEKNSLKVTPQREGVYKVLLCSKDHPSAEIVHKRIKKEFPNISFDTVNRTLHTLCDVGLAFIVESSNRVRRFDADMIQHQHFKCVRCKKIFDLRHKPFEGIQLPDELDSGCRILRKSVYIEGVCKDCLQEDKQTENIDNS